MIYIFFFLIVIVTFYFFSIYVFGEKYLRYYKNNWFQSKIINFRGKSGFSKKIHLVIIFFLFGFLISYVTYWNWLNENQAPKIVLEITSIDDFSISDTIIVAKNPELIKEIREIKNSSTSQRPFFSPKTVYEFFNERGDFIGWILSFYGFLTIIIGFYEWSKFEKFSLLFQKSKDKVKILNRFSSNNLFNENSIYENIINLLERVTDEVNLKQKTKVHLKMFLCSPLIDKNTTNYSTWGDDFVSRIRSIATNENLELKLYHLPNETISGVNPLRNFTEVLANYAGKISETDELDAFKSIWESTKKNITTLETLASHSNGKFTINETKLDDIPFQIIISKSPLLEEVIVFFASKSNLENEKVTEEPKGFHSVDPVVVEAFDKIFNDYVSQRERVPIRPEHTQNIIDKIKNNNNTVDCYNYLDSVEEDIFLKTVSGINIKIGINTFSPVIANSSKFTSRVIQETIRKNDIFLEIGAGSGVQTIVAYKMQQKLGNTNPKIYAIESSETAYEYLKKNCKTNKIYKELDNKRQSGAFIFNTDLNNSSISNLAEIKTELGNDKFTFIVADLPFVDTEIKENDKDLESAFFDNKHSLQNSLLRFFSESNHIIADEARLITSFSSLGGDLDILTFEMMINKNNLRTIKKVAFVENDYEWIAYVIMKKEFANENYWWNNLNVK